MPSGVSVISHYKPKPFENQPFPLSLTHSKLQCVMANHTHTW